jgi:hypothetical protein
MNVELERIWKEAVMVDFKNYPLIRPRGLRKIINKPVRSVGVPTRSFGLLLI